jgi:hypothetical protein
MSVNSKNEFICINRFRVPSIRWDPMTFSGYFDFDGYKKMYLVDNFLASFVDHPIGCI